MTERRHLGRWLFAGALAIMTIACGGGDDGGNGGGGSAPTISSVEWQPAAGCSAGVAGDYTVTVTATDPDTPTADLTISGMIASCTPSPFGGSPATVNCPNAASYESSVTVQDPEGNSDEVTFTVRVCMAGSAS